MIKKILPVMISFIIAGCVGIPDIQTPTVESPQSDYSSSGVNYQIKKEQWWTSLNDQQLNKLMTFILENNKDLKIADINIAKVQEQFNLNQSYNRPHVDFDASAKKERLSGNSFNPPEYSNRIIDMDNLGLNASYDFDLFKKTEHLGNQYVLLKQAEQVNKQWTELNLANQAVKLYAEYSYLSEEYILIYKQKSLYQNILKLEHYKMYIGTGTKDNLLSIENILKDFDIQLSQTEANLKLTMDSILILGNNNKAIEALLLAKTSSIFKKSMDVPLSYEAKIIAERPDVKYYLYTIEAQKEALKSYKADFYPNITLSGSLGFESITPNLLLSKSSLFASIAPAINLPIFDSGRIKSNYKLAGLDLSLFIENYNNTVAKAIKDVNDNLYKVKQKEDDLLNNQMKFNNDKEVFSNMESRFSLGKISNYDLQLEKNKIISSERTNNQLLLNRFNQKIDLINSLGGINITKGV